MTGDMFVLQVLDSGENQSGESEGWYESTVTRKHWGGAWTKHGRLLRSYASAVK